MDKGKRIVLFYGSPQHAILEPLYQHVRERGRRRAVFVPQERFPREVGICLGAGRSDPAGTLLPPLEKPVALDDVCGACLDFYYIDPRQLQDLDVDDIQYVQTESWAALIALFGRLALRPDCVVANHVTRRDYVSSRAACLGFLSACGLEVPRLLVTSDPAAARAFYEMCGDRTLYRPAGNSFAPLKQMAAYDLERVDAVRLAPVHFEEAPDGVCVGCTVVGKRIFVNPEGTVLPAELEKRCLDVCRKLDLHMAELSLTRVRADNRWIVTGLHPHLAPQSIEYPAVLEAAASLLEGGE